MRVRAGWENTSLTRLSLSSSYLNVFVELIGWHYSLLSVFSLSASARTDKPHLKEGETLLSNHGYPCTNC